MKRSHLLGVALACAIACVAAVSTVAHTTREVFRSFGQAVCRGIGAFVAAVVPASPARSDAVASKPRVLLLAARELLIRFVKRDSPRVTPRWRMCPST